MNGRPRRAVREPHMNSILAKLWRAHMERLFAQRRGEGVAEVDEKIADLSHEALRHGLTPVELKIHLKTMSDQTSAKHFRIEQNPKHPLSDNLEDDVRRYIAKGLVFSLSAEWDKGRTVIEAAPSPWGGKLALVVPKEKIFGVKAHDFFALPTVVHVLREVFLRLPEFSDYELKEHTGTRGSGHFEWADTGYTVARFMSELKLIREESIVRKGGRDTDPEDEPKTFEYWATASPQEMTWYHATLAKNVPSIEKMGLIPSSLGEDRIEGWSPGWNMGLQGAVYLTSNEGYARAIAETIASGNGESAVVLQVDGAGLEDTKLLTFDEDALRSDLDGSVLSDHYDRDFPQWVTSQEHSIRSIAYKGRIDPRFISVLATATVSVEVYARGWTSDDSTPETHPQDYEFVNEIDWDDDWGKEEEE